MNEVFQLINKDPISMREDQELRAMRPSCLGPWARENAMHHIFNTHTVTPHTT